MPIYLPLCLAVAGYSPAILPQRVSLDGPWQLSQAERKISIPAQVPGVVQTDLMRAGVIPDPFVGLNEKAVQWVSDVPWTYTRNFSVTPQFLKSRRIVLRCEGLDTFATVTVNGKEVGHADNMFRTWEFDAKPYLQAGANRIQVDFKTIAAFLKGNEGRAKSFDKPVQSNGWGYVRKAPFQGGWDFAPRLLTTGIWRKIGLIGWDAARLTDLEIVQDHTKMGQVGLDVKLAADGTGATSARTTVLFKGHPVAVSDTKLNGGLANGRLTIPKPQLWWPNGMGVQNLYDVRVELRDPNGRVVDQGSRRIGLHTVTWITKTDHTPLALVVNGRRFFAKGSNWVPPDSLIVRTTPAQEAKLVQQAVDAHMNLMRLWGGGFYETESFFDACDEKGLLVWFEFKYADAAYPSFDPVWMANVKAEAQDNVRRVRHHPSIAVYSGNNECIGFIADKTTQGSMSRDEYNLLFHTMLRDVVHDLAPDAAYTPGSPEIGDEHYWDVWHGSATFASYRNLHGFMSEYGFQAFPVPQSVEQFTSPSDRASVETPVMLQHQKNWRDGNSLIVSTSLRTYRKPKDFDSTLWLGQINQAEGIVTGVEHWRRDWPNSTASLVWQFDDPWPVTSWSMVDYYGRPKALYYRLKHAYAPIALSGLADGKSGAVELWVANDRFDAKASRLDWALTRLDGTVLQKGGQAVAIPAGTSSVRVLSQDLKAVVEQEGANHLLLWATLKTSGEPDSTTLLTFAKAKELDLVDPGIQTKVESARGGYQVTLASARPALWAWIELKGIDAELSDNFIHLQPGVPVTLTVTPKAGTTLDAVRKALVARSLFDTYLAGTEASPTLAPDANGRIVATADAADIDGDGPILEAGDPSNIGNWQNVDTSLIWKVKDAKAGTYAVTAVVSIPSNEAGSTFEVEVDGSRVTGTVPGTKSWTDYVEIKLGTLTIAKDGATKITLRSTSKPHDHVMNLRSITLTPARS